MVARDLTIERVSRRLPYAWLMLEELHDQAERWSEMPEWERADWSLEWAQFVNVLDEVLVPAYQAGDMTAEQRRDYENMVMALRQALALVERLHLTVPQMVVDTAA